MSLLALMVQSIPQMVLYSGNGLFKRLKHSSQKEKMVLQITERFFEEPEMVLPCENVKRDHFISLNGFDSKISLTYVDKPIIKLQEYEHVQSSL